MQATSARMGGACLGVGVLAVALITSPAKLSARPGPSLDASGTDPDAEDVESEAQPAGEAPEAPERDWSRLPDPGESSGIAVEEREPTRLWWIPRVGLFIPRLAFEAVSAPVRGAIWLVDEYQLDRRAEAIFFTETGTFGVYPIAFFEAGFGVTVGAQAIHRDLFGEAESASAHARYGGRFNQDYQLELDSGERLGDRFTAGLEIEYERKPKERFFGIGNGDEIEPIEVPDPVDPVATDVAVATRYREDTLGLDLVGALEVAGPLSVVGRSRIEHREFDEPAELGDDVALEDVYDPDAVLGYNSSLSSSYNEIELRWDDRAPTNRYVSAAMPSSGTLVSAAVGYDAPIAFDRPGFFQYTADLQRYFDLYTGSRVLGLRLLASQIDADTDEVPFVYLPTLGGNSLLRGYERGRFRDRGMVMASAEYKWEIAAKYGAAFAFVDAGRVQRSLRDLETGDIRVGYGLGLQLHTLDSFIARAHVATSIDGGVFFNLDFDPVIDARVRE